MERTGFNRRLEHPVGWKHGSEPIRETRGLLARFGNAIKLLLQPEGRGGSIPQIQLSDRRLIPLNRVVDYLVREQLLWATTVGTQLECSNPEVGSMEAWFEPPPIWRISGFELATMWLVRPTRPTHGPKSRPLRRHYPNRMRGP